MGSKRISHIVFAIVLIGWGILGLVKGNFASGWEPVPESMPLRQALAYFTSIVCIASGLGLLMTRTAVLAARIFFRWLLLWLLLLRIPWMIVAFQVGTWWSASSTALITATAWILYITVTNDGGVLAIDRAMRNARVLFGLGLIPLGLAHFIYLEATAPLVPGWMQWPVFWSYFTGAAFVAAGMAMIAGIFARPAAILITVQIAMLTLFVWVPRVVTGQVNEFQWGEFVVSIVLTVCAWVVADSYRATTRPETEDS